MLCPDCSYLLGALMPPSVKSLNLDWVLGSASPPKNYERLGVPFSARSSLAICSQAPTGTVKTQLLCLNAGQTEV